MGARFAAKECSAVRSFIDLRLTLTQNPSGRAIHATLTTADPNSPADEAGRSLASDVCERFDLDAFSDGFLRRLESYALQPISAEDLAGGGRVLADCLLPPSVRSTFLAQLQSRTAEQTQVRVRLSLTSLALAALPFEFTFVDDLGPGAAGGFLALHPNLHLVREVDAHRSEDDDAPRRKIDARPIRVLAVSADPATARYPHLPSIDNELRSLASVLQNAPDLSRSFQVDVLRHANPESLRRQIAETRPHVLHFLGHADSRPTGAFLVLLGEAGVEAMLPIDKLAGYLSQTPIMLVVISACGTPATVHKLAETLIESGGADDVVAMQLPLRDAMTRPFSRTLYSAYAEGSAIEDCVWQARQVIQGAGADWGVPVVYRRAQSMDAAEGIDTQPRAVEAELSRDETSIDETPALPELERPFIGRQQAVEAVLQKVRSQEQRLVTITGIGGMGKTTLSIQCARLLRKEFPGSVFYVSVDAMEGREAVVSALCAAFRIDPASAAKPETALIQGVRKLRASKRIILVIDCFETHIANAGLVEALLTTNPALSCVVTSRIALGLPREFQYPLDPMATAAIPELSPGKAARPRRTAQSESDSDAESPERVGALLTDSVALFREAARHVLPDFDVDATNEESVEALCRRLEGVPLALILAASRLRHLSVDELLLQVSSRPLKVLRRRRVGVESADRHADLQEVIAGSFTLLDDIDRKALRQFGVFVGGFGVDAALAVCDLEPDGDVLDGVSRLREHSLIQTDSRGGRTRYRLLDTVREYVSGLADAKSGDDDTAANSEMLKACRRRHAQHFVAVAQILSADMRQTDNAPALAQFWTELGNLRAAITYTIETNAVDMLISFADALARLYAEAGLWGDFDTLTAAAQSAHERRKEPVMRLRLLAYRAQMARRRGAETEARALLEQIREDCAARGDIPSEADALLELASQARDLGELDRARDLLGQASLLAASAGLTGIASNARALQASVACARGDRVRGEALATEAVDLLDSSTDRDNEIFTCVNVGRLWRESGILARAEPILLRALQVSLDGARTFGASRALLELGPVYEARDRLGQAAKAYLAAGRLHADLDASRRVEAATALRRFRRIHSSAPEVGAVTRAARFAPWNELAAQLLAEGGRFGDA